MQGPDTRKVIDTLLDANLAVPYTLGGQLV